jgi:hypothetical protein
LTIISTLNDVKWNIGNNYSRASWHRTFSTVTAYKNQHLFVVCPLYRSYSWSVPYIVLYTQT